MIIKAMRFIPVILLLVACGIFEPYEDVGDFKYHVIDGVTLGAAIGYNSPWPGSEAYFVFEAQGVSDGRIAQFVILDSTKIALEIVETSIPGMGWSVTSYPSSEIWELNWSARLWR